MAETVTLPKFAERVVKSEARAIGLNMDTAWAIVKAGEVVQVDAKIGEKDFREIIQMFVNDVKAAVKDGEKVYGLTPEQWLAKTNVEPPPKLSVTDQILQGIDGTVENAKTVWSFWDIVGQFASRPILIPVYVILCYAAFVVITKSVDKAGSDVGIGSIGTKVANQTVKNVKVGTKLAVVGAKKIIGK